MDVFCNFVVAVEEMGANGRWSKSRGSPPC